MSGEHETILVDWINVASLILSHDCLYSCSTQATTQHNNSKIDDLTEFISVLTKSCPLPLLRKSMIVHVQQEHATSVPFQLLLALCGLLLIRGDPMHQECLLPCPF